MTVIEELGQLQEDFFKKSGELYENIELLGDTLYKKMLADIIEVYKSESERLLRKAQIEYEASRYELGCKEKKLLPRRSGFLWLKRNDPAEIIFREVAVSAQEMFKRRTKALERLETALNKASEHSRPTDEPTENGAEKSTGEPPDGAAKPEKCGQPDLAPNSSLTAEKGCKPQTRTEEKHEKNSK